MQKVTYKDNYNFFYTNEKRNNCHHNIIIAAYFYIEASAQSTLSDTYINAHV